MSPANTQAASAALNGVRPVLKHFDTPRSAEDLAADIIDLWVGAEAALQALIGGSSYSGQLLIRAARQSEVVTLDQAHALLEFLAARDRANRTSYKPTQADGDAAVDGFRALESALTGGAPVKQSRPTPSSPLQAAYTPRSGRPAVSAPPPPAPTPPPLPQPVSPYAPPSAGGLRQPYMRPPSATGGPPTVELPPPAYTSANAGRGNIEHALEAAEAKRRRMPNIPLWVLIGIPVLLILLIGGWMLFGRGSGAGGLTAGVDAMQAGQREKARGEFAKAVKDNPNDATPHVFLARLAREEGDLTTARAQLDTALRLQPKNPIALREMGLILFSSRQYDLSRRFFVRAVQANPQDRASQGYLGCALMRLNRVQEGTKFINGAGNGAWTTCLRPVTTAAPPPL
ncbi:MAG TPA: tetratricopeptide repeat protein [Gemmatimonadaceae bacterium]|nr:tetratricopeptide repeat protein [Gemmatimonadaceae bacterium]